MDDLLVVASECMLGEGGTFIPLLHINTTPYVSIQEGTSTPLHLMTQSRWEHLQSLSLQKLLPTEGMKAHWLESREFIVLFFSINGVMKL